MGTLVEEIFSRKLGRSVKAGEIIFSDIDYMMTHDNTTPLAMKAFRDVKKPIYDKNRIVIHFDHAYPAPNLKAAEAQKTITDFIKEHDLPNFYHQGICHQVMIEEGFVKPGRVIIGGDSHSNTYGAFAALGVGFGSTEIGVSWATAKTWFRVPETVLVELNGRPQAGVTAKDIMLAVLGQITSTGGRDKSVEFAGTYIDSCPMHERIVLPNMSTELGATCGLIGVDQITIDFLENETAATGPFEKITAKDAEYERVVTIDVSTLIPQVACHPKIDNIKPIDEIEGLPIDEVFIGTCTNGRYEDLAEAAAVLKGRKVNRFTRTIITPASRKIYKKALDNGLIDIFHDAGCTIGVVGCGACIGRHGGLLGPKERAFTTMNRNFVGRMGSPEAEIYLGSPVAAAATAIEGKITDPRKYL